MGKHDEWTCYYRGSGSTAAIIQFTLYDTLPFATVATLDQSIETAELASVANGGAKDAGDYYWSDRYPGTPY